MPYQSTLGKGNLKWLLTDNELAFLTSHRTLPNRQILRVFNDQFGCAITYCRLRHFIAQYDLKKCDKGEKYTAAEYAYVAAHFLEMSDMHMGRVLGRTPKSVFKIRVILKLKRTPEAIKRLRDFRSKSGAKSYHARIAKGELEHPATHLHDSFVAGQMKRGTDLDEIPQPLIELKRTELKIKRELKKIAQNESESKNSNHRAE
jgi:hypothetical protein